jgi:spermidine/putrescine transport system permease protein
MVGQLVASQFNTAQNWALGSAMAITMMLYILATVLIVMLVATAVRWVLRERRRVTIAEEIAA